MLTIRNIKQIELTFCHSRGLREVTEAENKMGDKYYCFHFGPIGDGKGWNKEIEVRLCRDVKYKTTNGDGSYQIFVMGLQLVSENFILPSDIKSKDGLAKEITTVLDKAKHWWKTKS